MKKFFPLYLIISLFGINSIYSAKQITTLDNPYGFSAEFLNVKKIKTQDKRLRVKKGGEYEIAQDLTTLRFDTFAIPGINNPIEISVFSAPGQRGEKYYLYEKDGFVQVTTTMPMKGDNFALKITENGKVEIEPLGLTVSGTTETETKE